MPQYKVPAAKSPAKLKKKEVVLVASGDLRLSANQVCWPAQKAMETTLLKAVTEEGYKLIRAHSTRPTAKRSTASSPRSDRAWKFSSRFIPIRR